MPGWEGAVGLGLGLLFLGLWLGIRFVRWRTQRRGRRVARRGLRGEVDGVRVLEDAGYVVVDTQVRAKAVVEVDGEDETYELRIDAIVARDGRRFVAEFKTGNAASIGSAPTRRQLLEYALAFPDHGLLLIDASEGTLQEVGFPRLLALSE